MWGAPHGGALTLRQWLCRVAAVGMVAELDRLAPRRYLFISGWLKLALPKLVTHALPR